MKILALLEDRFSCLRNKYKWKLGHSFWGGKLYFKMNSTFFFKDRVH